MIFFSQEIKSNTENCLRHKSFVEALPESVIKMLRMQDPIVFTEGQGMLEHCLRWAENQPEGIR